MAGQPNSLTTSDRRSTRAAKKLPRLMTSEETASYLGISLRTLHRMRIAGEIGHVVLAGRTYRYTEGHVRSGLPGPTCRAAKGPAAPKTSVCQQTAL